MKEKNDELCTLASSISGILLAKLFEWRDEPFHTSCCPHKPVDYWRAANPYLAQYGQTWEDKIKRTTFMKQYICVRDLLQHIRDRTKEVF